MEAGATAMNGQPAMGMDPSGAAQHNRLSWLNEQRVRASTIDSQFHDDFGGSAIDATKWDVINGGLGANPTLNGKTLTQGAIGTGTTGMTDSVASSALTVNMNTTLNAERWYLSKQQFSGCAELLVVLSRNQALAANSVFIGLVEVDPTTGIPLLNPNLALDFTNRCGVEFAATTTSTAFVTQAVGDSSGSVAAGGTGTAALALSSTQEFHVSINNRDAITIPKAVDALTVAAAGASRVSTQSQNPTKQYKLLMRFKNTGTPGSNTIITIQRILAQESDEMVVQVQRGNGAQSVSESIPVNIAASVSLLSTIAAGSNLMGDVALQARATTNGLTTTRISSAASTNATSLKASAGRLYNGCAVNTTASAKFLKFYNKASAPTVGTDTPVWTIVIPANGQVNLSDVFGDHGWFASTGIAYAITGAVGDADTTAVAAGDVLLTTGHA